MEFLPKIVKNAIIFVNLVREYQKLNKDLSDRQLFKNKYNVHKYVIKMIDIAYKTKKTEDILSYTKKQKIPFYIYFIGEDMLLFIGGFSLSDYIRRNGVIYNFARKSKSPLPIDLEVLI